ncbi:MAG: FeoB-associated Cys-rich membrane protein [Firmicutes bacterium]|nr:FeoB-associated Cys-rich membrane protein [Bacillota bacterium]
MNVADLIVILILAGVVFLAVRSILRRRKNGSCCSGACASCMQKCSTANPLRKQSFYSEENGRRDIE